MGEAGGCGQWSFVALSQPCSLWSLTYTSFLLQLKEIRAIVISGGQDYEDFYQLLRQLEPSIQVSAKDLRSQVVREACISIA